MYLLPKPHNIKRKNEKFYLDCCTKIVIDINCKKNVYIYAKMLQETASKWAGLELAIVKGEARSGDIHLSISKKLKNQEYSVIIQEDRVSLVGGSEEALLYSIQTLRQIISQCGCVLWQMEITDEPDVEHRGFYHDATRGRVPTLSYLKKLVDRMSYYKLNELQLYVEHTYLFRDLSEMWRDETPLTAEEIMEIDRYCKERHIELVPSMASFGHMYTLLSTKSQEDLCEFQDAEKQPFSFWDRMRHHTINISNEKSLSFVKGMIKEYMSLFSSNKFNICADETFDLGKGRSKNFAEKHGIDRIYIDFVKELCSFLVKNGKTPMFWGDVISGFPEFLSELPKETICLNWGYSPEQREHETRVLSEIGATQYVCSGVAGWNQWINLIEASYHNIKRMCAFGSKYGAIGVLNTDWGDFGHINHPEFSAIGMIYGAAFSWNCEEMEFEEVNRQISSVEFLDKSEQIVSIIAKISGKSVFSWEHVVRYQEMLAVHSEKDRDVLYTEADRKEFFLEEDMKMVPEMNRQLDAIILELKECMGHMDSSSRGVMQSYDIIINGMQVWNLVGESIAHKVYHLEYATNCYEEVAVQLENWFMLYKELWRSVSKEGDIAQISNLVFWYADLLRGRERIKSL
ncbi:MAG TPA: family 20 glycosylhydrolase [Lachnospiraceae bacterium]|nr:family 20 glycosylhydrolase [Lachnospiraceae bacterium]